MTIRCFHLTDAGAFEPSDERPDAGWSRDGVRRLVVSGAEGPTLPDLLSPFHLPAGLLETISDEPSVRTKLFEGALTFCVPRAASAVDERGWLRAVSLAQTLFLVTEVGPTVTDDDLRRLALRQAGCASLAGTVAALIELMVDREVDYYVKVRDSIESLEEHIDELDRDEIPDKMFELGHRVRRMETVTEDWTILVAELLVLEASALPTDGLQPRFQAIAESLNQLERWLQRLEVRLRQLHEHYQLTLQSASDHRLRVLTILSAVFLPLTLVVGIYGMNFAEMPELNMPYAYFVCLGGMALITVAQVLYFWRRGWFS